MKEETSQSNITKLQNVKLFKSFFYCSIYCESKGILMNLIFLSEIFITDTELLELMYIFKGEKLFPSSISSSVLILAPSSPRLRCYNHRPFKLVVCLFHSSPLVLNSQKNTTECLIRFFSDAY